MCRRRDIIGRTRIPRIVSRMVIEEEIVDGVITIVGDHHQGIGIVQDPEMAPDPEIGPGIGEFLL